MAATSHSSKPLSWLTVALIIIGGAAIAIGLPAHQHWLWIAGIVVVGLGIATGAVSGIMNDVED